MMNISLWKNFLTRANRMLTKDGGNTTSLSCCTQPEGLWLTRLLDNDTALSVKVHFTKGINFISRWSLATFKAAMQSGSNRVFYRCHVQTAIPERPFYLSPVTADEPILLPRFLPKILKKIELVLGRDADVFLDPKGIFARSRKGCFTYSKMDGTQMPVTIKLPSCWWHLGGDHPEDNIYCEIGSDYFPKPLIRITGNSWIMCAPLEVTRSVNRWMFPTIAEHEMPAIKTDIMNNEEGKTCLMTPQGKFVMNI